MKKLFRIFKIQGPTGNKTAFAKAIPDAKKEEIKVYIPLTFDFTAYYDDNLLEDFSKEYFVENPSEIKNAEIICMSPELCNEMLYYSDSQMFECCNN
jgi:hypothetical protein